MTFLKELSDTAYDHPIQSLLILTLVILVFFVVVTETDSRLKERKKKREAEELVRQRKSGKAAQPDFQPMATTAPVTAHPEPAPAPSQEVAAREPEPYRARLMPNVPAPQHTNTRLSSEMASLREQHQIDLIEHDRLSEMVEQLYSVAVKWRERALELEAELELKSDTHFIVRCIFDHGPMTEEALGMR